MTSFHSVVQNKRKLELWNSVKFHLSFVGRAIIMKLLVTQLFCVLLAVFLPTVLSIIDGELIKDIEKYKYMVRIQYHNSPNISIYICGAIVISNRTVLTAAHCVKNLKINKLSFSLIFGTVDLDKPYHVVNITDENIVIHPEYSGGAPSYENDIAVMELKQNLTFDSNINQAKRVEKGFTLKTGDTITMLGYTEAKHPSRQVVDRKHLRSVRSTVADFKNW